MAVRDGDGFVFCTCGNYHWGLHGAAGVLLIRTDGELPAVLLQLRAGWTHGGGTWALPGGALDSHENPEDAATREAEEETGVSAEALTIKRTFTDDHGSWRYSTVIAHVADPDRAHAANAESVEVAWVGFDEVQSFDLHPGLAASWPQLLPLARATLDPA